MEELASNASSGDKKGHHHSSADKALEYLCWVVNAEVLFDFSLKTYDFELVIMVAKHTQKDPKEYLPYLKKLQDLSEIDPILMKNQVNYHYLTIKQTFLVIICGLLGLLSYYF